MTRHILIYFLVCVFPAIVGLGQDSVQRSPNFSHELFVQFKPGSTSGDRIRVKKTLVEALKVRPDAVRGEDITNPVMRSAGMPVQELYTVLYPSDANARGKSANLIEAVRAIQRDPAVRYAELPTTYSTQHP
jgi:hypothetical protein